MPIQPMSINSYSKIPDIEDVTPFERSSQKTKNKSTRWGLRFLILVVVVYLIYHFGMRHDGMSTSLKTVSVYSTSMSMLRKKGATGLRTMKLEDINSIGGSSLRSISFGNGKDCNSQGTLISIHVPNSNHKVEVCSNDVGKDPAILSIDSSVKFQTVIGFGGAFTEASALNFYKLPKESRDELIELYFGKSGIGLTLGRISINSCDFSVKSYSFDDIVGDFELEYFDTEVTHDNAYIIPMIRLAMEASDRPVNILASPWSPPAWMKKPQGINDTYSMTGSEWPNGLSEDPLIQASWASYIAKFITAYSYKGVPIWAITPQNEPEFPAPWEACAYNATGERDWINKHLGPTLEAIHPDVLILAFDHNKDHLKDWAETIIGGDEGGYIDGMAFHWYGGLDRLTDGTFGYNELNATHHFAPDKILLGTEGCSCPGVELDDWFRAERLGHDVLFDLQNHAQGWIDWNLLVDSVGGPNHLGNICDASLVCNSDWSGFHVQPKYYYFGHIAKFIPPGSVRVQSAIVGNFQYNTDIDPRVQGNLEVGMYGCERSSRQMWKLNSNGTIELSTPVMYDLDPKRGPHKVRFCVTRGDTNRKHYLRLTDCEYHSKEIEEIYLHSNKDGQLIDSNTGMCLSMADDTREAGALLNLQPCLTESPHATHSDHSAQSSTAHQTFLVDSGTGEISTPQVSHLCLTAGWPFLNAVAFQTNVDDYSSVSETVVVMMNEASEAASILLFDQAKDSKPMGLSIDARAMQTIVY